MEEKRLAGEKAAELVRDGDVVGLGTGSTVKYTILELGRRIREESLEISGIPTSEATRLLAIEQGIPLVSFEEVERVDIAIDGADQVSKRLELIKGGGGALFREKVVAANSKEFIVVVSQDKLSDFLNMYVPVEVLPFAWKPVQRKLQRLGARVKLREGSGKAGPVITDNGNYILDASFGKITNPKELEEEINSIVGVVENGIFTLNVSRVIVGEPSGVRYLP